MCDYSLHNVKSRPAKVGDKLTTHNFYTGTGGFAVPEDVSTAVCVLPGTELAFAKPVIRSPIQVDVKHPAQRPMIWCVRNVRSLR
jgi:hypothetical protein